jgi:hypothetical protein
MNDKEGTSYFMPGNKSHGSYLFFPENVEKLEEPPPGPSQDFIKIDGDALYVLATAITYVSRDIGQTWQVDTTGLNGAYINDFSLDTLQYVYVATSKVFTNNIPIQPFGAKTRMLQ